MSESTKEISFKSDPCVWTKHLDKWHLSKFVKVRKFFKVRKNRREQKKKTPLFSFETKFGILVIHTFGDG